MDKLDAEGKSWKEILSGGGAHLFKGLIISKLCNDSNFFHKIEIMDAKFAQKKYEEWQPYYGKLKERLNTVEPIYNI